MAFLRLYRQYLFKQTASLIPRMIPPSLYRCTAGMSRVSPVVLLAMVTLVLFAVGSMARGGHFSLHDVGKEIRLLPVYYGRNARGLGWLSGLHMWRMCYREVLGSKPGGAKYLSHPPHRDLVRVARTFLCAEICLQIRRGCAEGSS